MSAAATPRSTRPGSTEVFSSAGLRRLTAEMFGTFALVFAGTGAIVINDASGGAITHVGIALTFGLVVMALIYALGDVSGAHMNPAVTVGFLLARRFDAHWVVAYITSQCIGAVLASLVLRLMFPDHETLGATLPSGSYAQSFVLEFMLTFLLMFVVLQITSGSNEHRALAGMVIGGVVGLEAMFAGPICGASMNPARSLGPSIISGNLSTLWIYLAAPTLGAVSSVYLSRYLRPDADEVASLEEGEC